MDNNERIDLKISTVSGSTLNFIYVKDIVEWVAKERVVWTELRELQHEVHVNHQAMNTLLAPINDQLRFLDQLQNAIETCEDVADLAERISGILDEIKTEKYIISDSSVGMFITERTKDNPEIGYAILYWVKGNMPDVPNNAHQVVQQIPVLYMPVFKGYIEYKLYTLGIRGNIKPEKELINRLINDFRSQLQIAESSNADNQQLYDGWDSTLEALYAKKNEEFESSFVAFESKLTQIEQDSKNRLAALEDLYNSKLTLRAPVSYWWRKRISHLVVSFIFGVLFFGIAGAALYIFIIQSPTIFHEIKGMKEASSAGLIVAVGLPTLIFVWMLRVIARIFVQNLSYSADANERVAMTRTFLSLMQESEKVSEEDRILILQALFRSSSASGDDDGVPPNWFDLLLTRIKQG